MQLTLTIEENAMSTTDTTTQDTTTPNVFTVYKVMKNGSHKAKATIEAKDENAALRDWSNGAFKHPRKGCATAKSGRRYVAKAGAPEAVEVAESVEA